MFFGCESVVRIGGHQPIDLEPIRRHAPCRWLGYLDFEQHLDALVAA